MSKGKEKFLEIKALFKRLSDEMCRTVEIYWIWQTLAFARSIPEVGKEEAEKNVIIINRNKYFFMPVEDSLLHAFIIGLSKFFDKNPQSLSIAALIKKIHESKEEITADVLLEVYPDHFNDDENLKKNYSPLNDADIKNISDLKLKHKLIIENLKIIRDKRSAHTDIAIIRGEFIPKDVEALILAIQEMLNKLSSTFNRSKTIWDHLKTEAINDTKLLIENLERGEEQRMAEIKKRFSLPKPTK